MLNKKLSKHDRALNAFKFGAKRTRKVFQKVQPILNKVKPIINPRNALFGFILMSFLKPAVALATPNPLPEVPNSPENVTVAL